MGIDETTAKVLEELKEVEKMKDRIETLKAQVGELEKRIADAREAAKALSTKGADAHPAHTARVWYWGAPQLPLLLPTQAARDALARGEWQLRGAAQQRPTPGMTPSSLPAADMEVAQSSLAAAQAEMRGLQAAIQAHGAGVDVGEAYVATRV